MCIAHPKNMRLVLQKINKYLSTTSHLTIFKSTAGIQRAKENLQFGLIAPIGEVKAEAFLARTLALCQHDAKLTC